MSNFILELKKAIGAEYVSADPSELVAYSYDATGREGRPDCVVHVRSVDDVSAVMKLADAECVPVYPRGAGSGLVGGSVPGDGGVVLDLAGMNKIVRIEQANLTAVVEPGVVTEEFQSAVEKVGLFYPPDPASAAFGTIGGGIANCAGGLRGLKYGVTRDYVLGLEAVLPSGIVINLGGSTMKNVTGYDLTRLIVGSEGTLAVVTKAILKLLPLPECASTCAAFFRAADEALAAASALLANRLLPRALEFLNRPIYKAMVGYSDYGFPAEVEAMLMVEFDGPQCHVGTALSSAVGILREFGAFKIVEAYEAEERERLWTFRRSISAALLSKWAARINEDICVPLSKIPEMLKRVREISARMGREIGSFGHLGDGNLHVNIHLETREETEREHGEKIACEVFREAIALGGTLSGEHGIGLSKSPYLEMDLDSAQIALMRGLKEVFDPHNILNPGKIFPAAKEETQA